MKSKWAQNHPDRIREINRESYRKRREKVLGWHKNYYKQNAEEKKKKSRTYEKMNRKLLNEKMRIRVAELRLKALTHYSKEKLNCSKCGYSNILALDIDHIDGGGNQHRKSLNTSIYRWLHKENYPKGFQVLCRNCNWIQHRLKLLKTPL